VASTSSAPATARHLILGERYALLVDDR